MLYLLDELILDPGFYQEQMIVCNFFPVFFHFFMNLSHLTILIKSDFDLKSL